MKFSVFFVVILANEISCLKKWVQMDPKKSLPANAVVGGGEYSQNYRGPLYIGRKQIGNELVIGKVIDAWKSGYCELKTFELIVILTDDLSVPKDRTEHWSDNYEVLCMDGYSWIPKDENMTNAIVGGKAGDDEPFYVCSGRFEGIHIPGKLYLRYGCCYVTFYGVEHCTTDYSYLSSSIAATTSSEVEPAPELIDC
jgi:hypothetical protein